MKTLYHRPTEILEADKTLPNAFKVFGALMLAIVTGLFLLSLFLFDNADIGELFK